jgi:hypothetical protein
MMLPGVGGAERLLSSVKATGAPRTATARTRSPSATINSPNDASQRRIAFSSIVSNTGARSPGEELMTWSTSAVAVCCANASSRSARDSSSLRCRSAMICQGSAAAASEYRGHLLLPLGHAPNDAQPCSIPACGKGWSFIRSSRRRATSYQRRYPATLSPASSRTGEAEHRLGWDRSFLVIVASDVAGFMLMERRASHGRRSLIATIPVPTGYRSASGWG